MKRLFIIILIVFVMVAFSARTKAENVPIVDVLSDGGYLIGGFYNGKWLETESMASHLKGGEKYKFYSLTKFLGQGTGKKPDSENNPGTYIDISNSQEKEDAIAVSTTWNALPRVPKPQSNNQKIYIDAIAAELKNLGISNPEVKITQNIKVDLEGDGQDEVIISASRVPKRLTDNARKGDYTLVILRKIVAGKVKTFVLVSEIHKSSDGPPTLCDVRAILDLDGDKSMEIINSCVYYEGGGLNIHKVQNGKITKVLGGGWGS